jgi:hypothetical protein
MTIGITLTWAEFKSQVEALGVEDDDPLGSSISTSRPAVECKSFATKTASMVLSRGRVRTRPGSRRYHPRSALLTPEP